MTAVSDPAAKIWELQVVCRVQCSAAKSFIEFIIELNLVTFYEPEQTASLHQTVIDNNTM